MNETKLHEFMGKVVTDMGGAWMMAMVLVGDELGLYKAMADGTPVTAEALAARCDCHPRLVREWLDANAASGYLEAVDGGYRLPPEQAMALANEDSPVFVAPGQSVVAACFMDLDKLIQAFKGNGALPRGAHHDVPRCREVLPPGPSGQPHDRVAAGPRGRGPQARAWRQGGGRRLRSRSLHGRHGQGLPEVAVRRHRLPQAVRRDRRPACGGRRRGRPREIRDGHGPGVHGP